MSEKGFPPIIGTLASFFLEFLNQAMLSMLVSACLMGHFFETLRVSRDWCVSQGESKATRLILI